MAVTGWIGPLAAVFGVVTVMSRVAPAATANASMDVTAAVGVNCTISTAPVAFGAYDPVVGNASTPLDSTGLVTVACTKGAVATVGLDLGSHASGGTRRLSNGGSQYLTYELYKESARTTVWGNGGAALLGLGAAPSKFPRNFTVYGQVPAGQDVPAGTYGDAVVATVNF